MKRVNYIIIGLAATLAACSSDDMFDATHPANNAIAFSAGVSGGNMVETRAETNFEDFTEGTQLRLNVTGTWSGHTPENVVKNTTGAIATNLTSVTFGSDEMLYWDDYGTADPANTKGTTGTEDKGREKGLTVYGVAVNNVTTAPAVSNWEDLSWVLDADQTSGWSEKDLLTTCNVKGTNTYKWSEHAEGKQLLFTHAMSKITINLTAGDGFDGKFADEPTATLHGFTLNGSVKVSDGTVTAGTTTDDIDTHCLNATKTQQPEINRDAIVMPGRTLAATDEIMTVSADGNNYIVTAAKLVEKMGATPTLKSGKNYILNIKVNKTGIKVSATIQNWVNVEADIEAPVINIATPYGSTTGTPMTENFSFYRSEAINASYGKKIGSYYETDAVAEYNATNGFALNPKLYWPNHNTAYYFRAVWPETTTTADDATKPKVEMDGDDQVIKVENSTYKANTFPSDLMIGIPREETAPIKATEGKITMNFNYAMAHVTVIIKSTGTTAAGNLVTFGNDTKVEIINGYKNGSIKMSDGSAVMGTTPADYTMEHGAPVSNEITCESAILPQAFNTGEGLKFSISVKDGSGYDVYQSVEGIAEIPVSVNGQTATTISRWEAGKHYTYTLDIKKTGISVSATVSEWTEANGGTTPVWL